MPSPGHGGTRMSVNNVADDTGQMFPSKVGPWQRLRRGIIRFENEFAALKGVALLSVVGTLIGAYFHDVSAYDDKVSAQAKEDLTYATQTFADASTALSMPLTLQERMIFGYFDAVDQKVDTDDSAFVTKNARAIDASYEEAYSTLRENINLLAQKLEIYVDWASDTKRDPAANTLASRDPITDSSVLGTYNFQCDTSMPPKTDKDPLELELTADDGTKIKFDWKSAKHEIFAIYYCFNIVHTTTRPLREWASGKQLSPEERSKFNKGEMKIEDEQNKQLVRLYAFMNLVMRDIDKIRVRYRPRGYLCSVPIAREIDKKCMPLRTADQTPLPSSSSP